MQRNKKSQSQLPSNSKPKKPSLFPFQASQSPSALPSQQTSLATEALNPASKNKLDHYPLLLFFAACVFFFLGTFLYFTSADMHAKTVLLATHGEIPSNATTGNQTAGNQSVVFEPRLGSIATLDVQITPGKGSVYVDTYPHARGDTIISARLGKAYACQLLEKDCSAYDFFYTIKSDAPIIGGPSAGAAMAIATIAAFESISLDRVAITGTITSGGMIGPVGGLKQKIDAAAKENLKLVIIPAYDSTIRIGNASIDPRLYGAKQGISVASFASIPEAIEFLTGKRYGFLARDNEYSAAALQTKAIYEERMRAIASNLCTESYVMLEQQLASSLQQSLPEGVDPSLGAIQAMRRIALEYRNISLASDYEKVFFLEHLATALNPTLTSLEATANYENGSDEVLSFLDRELLAEGSEQESGIASSTFFLDNNNVSMVVQQTLLPLYQGVKKLQLAEENLVLDRYYAAASFCFGANLDFGYLALQQRAMQSNQLQSLAPNQTLTKVSLKEFQRALQEEIALETARIERIPITTLDDLQTKMIVKERLDDAQKRAKLLTLHDLSYAHERLKTAKHWSVFFNNTGRALQVGTQSLKQSCSQKLAEVAERDQYLEYMFLLPLGFEKENLNDALRYQAQGEYELCLFSASKAKAQLDILITVLGASQDSLGTLLDDKLKIIEANILEQDGFPLLGYSYYEYALALKHQDQNSALLYAEYALELSDLRLYFPQQTQRFTFHWKTISLLCIGISFGLLAALVIRQCHNVSSKKVNSKTKR